MRSSKEEAQDRVLHQFDKSMRNDKYQANRPMSLKDQLAEADRAAALTPSERRSEMSFSDWEREMMEQICDKQAKCTPRRMRIFLARNRDLFNTWHKKGTSYTEIIRWIEDQPDEF